MGSGRLAAVWPGVLALGLMLCSRGEAGPALPLLGPARNFVLTTQQNDRVWLTQLRPRVVVLTFTCTTCGGCPGLLDGLIDLSRTLGQAASGRVFFVAVSVDPWRDTAPVLQRFARAHGLDLGTWVLFTGAPAEIDAVTRWYDVDVRRTGERLTYRCGVTLIDAAGVIRGAYHADERDPLRADIEALLGEPGGS